METQSIKIESGDLGFLRNKEEMLGDALLACVKALSIAHRHLPCERGADWEQGYWEAITKARESLNRATAEVGNK